LRRLLAGLGLSEAQGQTLVGGDICRLAGVEPLALANPLSSDMNVLRPSLLPGMLEILRHNSSRQIHDLGLFEIGRVFVRAGAKTQEERRVAIVMTGRRERHFWAGADRDARCGIQDLKGIVEELVEHFGLRGVVFNRRQESNAASPGLYLESASILLGGKLALGELG